MPSSENARIYFVDFARSFAIVLALTDHSMNDFNVWHNYSNQTFTILKTFTTSATPTFLLLFGMMLEIIYRRKLEKSGIRKMASQMVTRSFQCYIGYVLTVIAGFVGGLLTFKNTIAATFFFGNCHFGNILKLYTVMLLLAVPLVWFRQKYGITKTVLLGISPWLIYPLYQFIPPLQDNLAIFTSYFFGFGGKGGPSILNSLTLVVVGMLVASFISVEKKRTFQVKALVILAIISSFVALVFVVVPLHDIIQNHTHNVYRNMNNPIYYLFSCVLALLVALISSVIIPIGKKINKITFEFLAFGRSSLTAFTVANVVLSLIAVSISRYTWNVSAPILFVTFIFFILQFYEKIYPDLKIVKRIQLFFRGVTVRFHWLYVRKLSNGFAQYLS